jgi:hypothetical protein
MTLTEIAAIFGVVVMFFSIFGLITYDIITSDSETRPGE